MKQIEWLYKLGFRWCKITSNEMEKKMTRKEVADELNRRYNWLGYNSILCVLISLEQDLKLIKFDEEKKSLMDIIRSHTATEAVAESLYYKLGKNGYLK